MQTAYEAWLAEYDSVTEWRLTRATNDLFMELMEQLEHYTEGTDEHEAIMDQIRSLPGHPNNGPTTRRDLIMRVFTDFQVGAN